MAQLLVEVSQRVFEQLAVTWILGILDLLQNSLAGQLEIF